LEHFENTQFTFVIVMLINLPTLKKTSEHGCRNKK